VLIRTIIYTFMKRLFTTLLLSFTMAFSYAQTYLVENFNYSTNDSLANTIAPLNNWIIVSGTTVNAIRANVTGLTYAGYTGSAIGNGAYIMSTGQDIVKDASSAITSGTVYTSFMAKFDTVRAAGDYFFAMLPTGGTTTYTTRLFAKLSSNTSYYRVAITKSTEAAVYSNDSFLIGATQFFVVKYQFNTNSTLDDSIRVYVFNSGVPASEPSLYTGTLVTPPTAADASSIQRIALRQGTAANAAALTIDGIRFGTTWGNTVLPVNFTSFNAIKQNTDALLTWSTASEINNNGFAIEKSLDGKTFNQIGFVKGAANSNKLLSYNFTDNDLSKGTSYYRLKQIDMDGNYTFSKTVTVVNEVAKKATRTLPNPFNNELNIHVTADAATTATVEVMDMLGKVHYSGIETLTAGDNKININTSNLTDGIYFVRMNINGELFTQKIIKK